MASFEIEPMTFQLAAQLPTAPLMDASVRRHHWSEHAQFEEMLHHFQRGRMHTGVQVFLNIICN
jgi:hypothetical protein